MVYPVIDFAHEEACGYYECDTKKRCKKCINLSQLTYPASWKDTAKCLLVSHKVVDDFLNNLDNAHFPPWQFLSSKVYTD